MWTFVNLFTLLLIFVAVYGQQDMDQFAKIQEASTASSFYENWEPFYSKGPFNIAFAKIEKCSSSTAGGVLRVSFSQFFFMPHVTISTFLWSFLCLIYKKKKKSESHKMK